MFIIIISLFSLSALLFILSFFYKGPEAKIEKEIEQFSLEYLQEMYQLKKRIRVLEEEIMQEDSLSEPALLNNPYPVHEVIQNKVVHLYRQGLSIDEIAKQSALSKNEVSRILENQGGDLV